MRVFPKIYFGGVGLLLILGGMSFFFRLNTTSSVPRGVYLLTSEDARPGEIVYFCPPANDIVEAGKTLGFLPPGSCKSGTTPFFKVLAGVPGDLVRIDSTGVYVNDEQTPFSAPASKDSLGRAIPRIGDVSLRLKAGQWILMGVDAGSFDSRYFGVVSKDDYIKRADLLLSF